MLKRLITAIAQLIQRTAQPTVGIPVSPIQAAGPVNQEPTTPAGNKPSAQPTRPRKSPAQPRTSKKPKAAPSTKAVSKSTSKKSKPAPTARSAKAAGSSTPTPVRKTRQRAK